MGRNENLLQAFKGASSTINNLAKIKADDIKNRKKAKKSHKIKYSIDINKISSAIEQLKDVKATIRVIPKSVQ